MLHSTGVGLHPLLLYCSTSWDCIVAQPRPASVVEVGVLMQAGCRRHKMLGL